MKRVSVIIAHRKNEPPLLDQKMVNKLGWQDVEIIHVSGNMPSVQRNKAAAKAHGDILYFLDNDAVPGRQNLQRIIDIFDNNPEVMVCGGPSLTPETDSIRQKSFGHVLGSFWGSAWMSARYKSQGKSRFCSDKELILCNLAFRRNIFLKCTGFDEKLYPNEENDLMDRIEDSGGRLFYDPEIIVTRSQRQGFFDFCRQLFGYGRGRSEQLRLDFRWSKLPLFVFAALPIYVLFLPLLLYSAPIFLLPVLFHFLIDIFFSIPILIKKPLVFFCAIPSFFLCHFFYGLGMWRGLFGKYRSTATGDVSFTIRILSSPKGGRVCKPLIIQSDMTVLFEVDTPVFESVRARLSSFGELEKSPEYIHTYRITPVSVWNAASSGVALKDVEVFLERRSKYDIPQNVLFELRDLYSRFGKLVLTRDGDNLLLQSEDPVILEEARSNKRIGPFLLDAPSENSVYINPSYRGHLKKEFIEIGFPVRDEAGYTAGTPFSFSMKSDGFSLRDYQMAAVDAFYEDGADTGGSGTVVLPCGAGKTIVGMGVMAKYQCQTLILTTNIVALRQWKKELIEKTNIDPESIGEYSGEVKSVRPVTIATYNIVTYRRDKEAEFEHFGLFSENNWGLVVYDEVHLLPAPVFRVTAELQARRRLGLTATLIREDGLETDVFSLIGPKKYDMPWKELENRSWIARAMCHEFRIAMNKDLRLQYISGGERRNFVSLLKIQPKRMLSRSYLKSMMGIMFL